MMLVFIRSLLLALSVFGISAALAVPIDWSETSYQHKLAYKAHEVVFTARAPPAASKNQAIAGVDAYVSAGGDVVLAAGAEEAK